MTISASRTPFPRAARWRRLSGSLAPLMLPALACASLEPLSNVAQLTTRDSHGCVLTQTGGVRCWGDNSSGQLGDGSTQDRLTAVDVVGLGSGVQAVRTGRGHTCALTTQGAVRCWGRNTFGQLGDGSTSNRLTPTPVTGLNSGVVAISLGDAHSCAITSAGAVQCWGHNFLGQLGNNSDSDRPIPGAVAGLTSGVQTISAGHHHTCAVLSTGGARCWGYNLGGQLGDGSTVTRFAPVNVSGLGSGVAAISAGVLHTCAVTGAGAAKCWGNNVLGQLGDGTVSNRLTPVDVSGLGSAVAMLGAGHYHSCAMLVSGAIRCWGNNYYGQLGIGIDISRELTPVPVPALASTVQSIQLGRQHSCAVLSNGLARCWGDNRSGQLGIGEVSQPTFRLTPVDVLGLSSGVQSIAAGADHTCARTTAGSVQCWGSNGHGQLGDGSTARRFAPVSVSGLPGPSQALAAGGRHSCALHTNGSVRCWGDNQYGQLGATSGSGPQPPLAVTGLSGTIAAISIGPLHSCALNTGGRVSCWGYPPFGQGAQPVTLADLVSGIQAISAGGDHNCVLTTAGAVRCWGSNLHGQFGYYGDNSPYATVAITGLESGIQAISAGLHHSCALATGGRVECWGSNTYGQGGSPAPVTVSGVHTGMQAVSAGGSHNCALSTGGAVRCWGNNLLGQLGDGSGTSSWMPVQVAGLGSGIQAISAGDLHVCALTTAGGVKCWGDNEFGQIGDGVLPGVPLPQSVMHEPTLFRNGFELANSP